MELLYNHSYNNERFKALKRFLIITISSNSSNLHIKMHIKDIRTLGSPQTRLQNPTIYAETQFYNIAFIQVCFRYGSCCATLVMLSKRKTNRIDPMRDSNTQHCYCVDRTCFTLYNLYCALGNIPSKYSKRLSLCSPVLRAAAAVLGFFNGPHFGKNGTVSA